MNYYNEFDPKAAAWIQELIYAGHIPYGYVDTRSIEDVRPSDLAGFTQCHFFAGIGVWAYALRRAGWSDDRAVWTASCPCQPFSAAGQGAGFDDERHLWPHLHHLIRVCRPAVVFGEQVASKDGLGWLDLVSADLEGENYAVAAADLCAAGVGAPHIRQRLYWVADADGDRPQHQYRVIQGHTARSARPDPLGGTGRVADADKRTGREGGADVRGGSDRSDAQSRAGFGGECLPGGMADTDDRGEHALLRAGSDHPTQDLRGGADVRPGRHLHDLVSGCDDGERPRPTDGFWRDADWLHCRDGRWRPVEPGTFPLVDGAPARVGRLRGFGNALVAPLAQAFIEAYMSHDR